MKSLDFGRDVVERDGGGFTMTLVETEGEEVVEDVTNRVLKLMSMKLVMKIFPYLHLIVVLA